ncbi:sodium channel protein Nach-like [Cydia pomonella]|uniref:sodium channel protein Nach-like n=1 Tax=Cydia pomonella TaxID=82600 RepID=UPI002ADE166B|nr:sodium channel protein Nach-like [Cydia pomonella]XP_061728810.1 sodium channel protein Nach-like [Cydia pomonella]
MCFMRTLFNQTTWIPLIHSHFAAHRNGTVVKRLKMWSKIKGHVLVFYRRFQHTCEHLTVHGPSFFMRKDVHFIYRLIYFIIYVHVWIAAVATIRRYYNHYQENTIRFTTRTDYLDWNTTFASITLCEIPNVDKIYMLSQEINPGDKGKLDRFIGEIGFFNGLCHSCFALCDNEPLCPTDFGQLSLAVRSECKDLLLSCKWNGIPFECCSSFQPIITEYGTCYSMNNVHGPKKSPVYQTSNKDRQASIEIVASQDYEAFLHAPEDIPFWNMEYDRRLTVLFGAEANVTYSITNVVNEPEVSLLSPEIRQCRFPNEVPENYIAYKYYSYSGCISQCRIDAQLELCNCTHHFSPQIYEERYCDLEGLKCLSNNFRILRKLRVPGMNETGLICDCLPSCEEPDFNVVAKDFFEPEENVKARSAKFSLSNRPYERITRQVARTTLDLVVAIGNSFGLCFGGSLLSIVEVFYYLCFKRWKYKN